MLVVVGIALDRGFGSAKADGECVSHYDRVSPSSRRETDWTDETGDCPPGDRCDLDRPACYQLLCRAVVYVVRKPLRRHPPRRRSHDLLPCCNVNVNALNSIRDGFLVELFPMHKAPLGDRQRT